MEAKRRGPTETMDYDEDYIRPWSGDAAHRRGRVGVDRLAMLLTDSPSIRRRPLPAPQAAGSLALTWRASLPLRLSPAPRMRWALAAVGGACIALGVVLLILGLSHRGGSQVALRLGLGAFGWGPLVMAMRGLVDAGRPGLADPPPPSSRWRWGCGSSAGRCSRRAFRAATSCPRESPAVGAPLWPPLARWRDFDLRTLAAYALAICGAELVLVLLHTLLALGLAGVGWGPPTAFGGGAQRHATGGGLPRRLPRRDLVPSALGARATIAVLYCRGVPLPLLLSALPGIPALEATLAPASVRWCTWPTSSGAPELG